MPRRIAENSSHIPPFLLFPSIISAKLPGMDSMTRLPIYDEEARIVEALRTENRLIVVAPTGSGKSTQVPQMLLQHGIGGDGRIVVL